MPSRSAAIPKSAGARRQDLSSEWSSSDDAGEASRNAGEDPKKNWIPGFAEPLAKRARSDSSASSRSVADNGDVLHATPLQLSQRRLDSDEEDDTLETMDAFAYAAEVQAKPISRSGAEAGDTTKAATVIRDNSSRPVVAKLVGSQVDASVASADDAPSSKRGCSASPSSSRSKVPEEASESDDNAASASNLQKWSIDVGGLSASSGGKQRKGLAWRNTMNLEDKVTGSAKLVLNGDQVHGRLRIARDNSRWVRAENGQYLPIFVRDNQVVFPVSSESGLNPVSEERTPPSGFAEAGSAVSVAADGACAAQGATTSTISGQETKRTTPPPDEGPPGLSAQAAEAKAATQQEVASLRPASVTPPPVATAPLASAATVSESVPENTLDVSADPDAEQHAGDTKRVADMEAARPVFGAVSTSACDRAPSPTTNVETMPEPGAVATEVQPVGQTAAPTSRTGGPIEEASPIGTARATSNSSPPPIPMQQSVCRPESDAEGFRANPRRTFQPGMLQQGEVEGIIAAVEEQRAANVIEQAVAGQTLLAMSEFYTKVVLPGGCPQDEWEVVRNAIVRSIAIRR